MLCGAGLGPARLPDGFALASQNLRAGWQDIWMGDTSLGKRLLLQPRTLQTALPWRSPRGKGASPCSASNTTEKEPSPGVGSAPGKLGWWAGDSSGGEGTIAFLCHPHPHPGDAPVADHFSTVWKRKKVKTEAAFRAGMGFSSCAIPTT